MIVFDKLDWVLFCFVLVYFFRHTQIYVISTRFHKFHKFVCCCVSAIKHQIFWSNSHHSPLLPESLVSFAKRLWFLFCFVGHSYYLYFFYTCLVLETFYAPTVAFYVIFIFYILLFFVTNIQILQKRVLYRFDYHIVLILLDFLLSLNYCFNIKRQCFLSSSTICASFFTFF